jgi:hypothetical protein
MIFGANNRVNVGALLYYYHKYLQSEPAYSATPNRFKKRLAKMIRVCCPNGLDAQELYHWFIEDFTSCRDDPLAYDWVDRRAAESMLIFLGTLKWPGGLVE